MSLPLLRLAGISKRYPGVQALTDVSLDVPAGQLRAVIGPNGAGKSTLFGVISGEYPPEAGVVELDGKNITGWPPWKCVRLGMARAFQVAKVFPRMTVYDNVLAAVMARDGTSWQFWRLTSRVPGRKRVDGLLAETGLLSLAETPAAVLSQGDRKRLEIAIALALEPRLLLLDEPTAGMSPEETHATVELIRQLWRERGLTVMLTEHDMGVVFALAEEITVLHRGRILCTGSPEEIRGRQDVREVYLGDIEL
ncbi:MAG: ABC transporter ATP-binding protein [Dehalococcoidia bacterium]|nr:MAG: ABC transporter ATP-binding protein [Dehalococcoidia bacterium]